MTKIWRSEQGRQRCLAQYIRKLIGPSKARLLRYTQDAEKLLSAPINDKEVEEEEINVEELIDRFSTNISILERCNHDWVSLLREMHGEAKDAEEKEQTRVAEGTEGYVEVLINASEVVSRLNSRLKRIERKIEQQNQFLETQKNLSSQAKVSNIGQDTNIKVNLPKLQLPCFDGNVQQWPEFWDMFKTSVDEQNLPKVSKFNYLKSVLKGTAATAISGLSIDNKNYDTAIALLKERYGRKEVIVESLYAKLQSLPRSCNKFTEIQKTYDCVEKTLQQLEAQGESINNQRMLIQLVLYKFPTEVVMKLEETKKPTDVWDMKMLRSAIFQFVRIQENVYRYAIYSKSCLDKPVHQVTNVKGYHPTNNIPAEVFSSISDSKSVRIVMRPCIFCKGDHYNDHCDRYKNLSERKQKLSSDGRCFICLKPGHVVKSCPISQKKACDHCGKKGYHNRCLCPDKFPEGANMFCVTEHNRASDVADSSSLPSAKNSLHDESSPTEQTVGFHVTHTMLASNERVLLQTAIVPIQTSDGQTLINARVLLDSASQRTFTTTKFAQKLKLHSEHKENLSVSTFGAQKAKEC